MKLINYERKGLFKWFESGIEDTGRFGINIHRSSAYPFGESVGGWSAGCQVFRNETDFDSFMDLVVKSSSNYGNSFTYTLFAQKNLEDYVMEAEGKLGLTNRMGKRS